MKLSEFLGESGWSKAAVARALGISSPAVALWDEVPDKHVAALSGFLSSSAEEPKVVRKCHPRELPDDEFGEIIQTISKKTIWGICQEHGWRVWEFNDALAGWVSRNPPVKPKDGYDLSKYKGGGVV